jgi:hypothetical protein
MDLKTPIEPTLIAILMAEHPRLGEKSTIPHDIAFIVARNIYTVRF